MHIERISYTKTFNIGNYQSEKIGVDICLSEGDNAKDALNSAKELVEEYHKEGLKSLPTQDEIEYGFSQPSITIPTQSKKTLAEKTIHEIDQCKNEGELKAWELMASKYPEVLEHYNAKLKSFKSKK